MFCKQCKIIFIISWRSVRAKKKSCRASIWNQWRYLKWTVWPMLHASSAHNFANIRALSNRTLGSGVNHFFQSVTFYTHHHRNGIGLSRSGMSHSTAEILGVLKLVGCSSWYYIIILQARQQYAYSKHSPCLTGVSRIWPSVRAVLIVSSWRGRQAWGYGTDHEGHQKCQIWCYGCLSLSLGFKP